MIFQALLVFLIKVPTRDEWENSLPRFRGEEWEVPAEHLLDFHDCMHRLQVVHEDVQIRLFCFSLEGISHDWYRSLPNASISSLADFHAAFNLFCKTKFSTDLLYPGCCHEFSLLHKEHDTHEEHVAVEENIHYVQEIVDSYHDSHEDVINIVSNSFIKDDCHDDQIVFVEIFKDEDQITPSENFEHVEHIGLLVGDSFRSTEIEEDSLPFPDLQGLSNLQLGNEDHNPECVATAYVLSSPHFPDLQTKTDFNRLLQEGQQNGADQQSVLYVSPTNFEQAAFNSEIIQGNFQHLFVSQLEQQSKEVFHCEFNDLFADFLESMSSIDVKIFLPEEGHLYHLFKPLFCMIWFSLFSGSRSIMMTVNQFLSWLHWKSSFT